MGPPRCDIQVAFHSLSGSYSRGCAVRAAADGMRWTRCGCKMVDRERLIKQTFSVNYIELAVVILTKDDFRSERLAYQKEIRVLWRRRTLCPAQIHYLCPLCLEKPSTQHILVLQTRSQVHTDLKVPFPTLQPPPSSQYQHPQVRILVPLHFFLTRSKTFKSQSTSSTHCTPPRLGRLSHLDAPTSTSRSLEYLRSRLALRPPSHRHPPSPPA
jgi:hypothetical protein